MRVAVAGGTGLVGRAVVAKLAGRGHDPVVLARAVGMDLRTGSGLAAALDGVASVVNATDVKTVRRRRAVEFFSATQHRLDEAAAAAGVGHGVVLSIVGCDRVDLGYYQGKHAQEQVALAGPVPTTVLRTTQFFEFVGQTLALTRGPVAVVPRLLVQPVALAEVAEALVEHALAGPSGLAPELAGPEQHELPDLARRVLRARRSRRLLLPVPLPGVAGRAMTSGALLPSGGGRRGRQTFDRWLHDHAGR